LDGIEVFSALKHFEVDYCRKLKSINGLACLANLETLKICDCNGLENLEEFFCRLRTLKELSMFTIETAARQHLKSLSFIEAMESLQSFVSNYIINDNDLTPLLRLKNAEIFEEKSYYNLRDQDLPKWDK
jgi:hypothetical protein